MSRLSIAGGEASPELLRWLADEGYQVVSEEARLKIWIAFSAEPPATMPPGPWLVLGQEEASHDQRRRWLALLGEDSSLLLPWTPATLRPTLRSLLSPTKPAFLDSGALARLYSQGGRILADHMVRNFTEFSPGLLQQADELWSQGSHQEARELLSRVGELAGRVGASDLEALLNNLGEAPDFDRLRQELESARRVLNHQHRQDRTV